MRFLHLSFPKAGPYPTTTYARISKASTCHILNQMPLEKGWITQTQFTHSSLVSGEIFEHNQFANLLFSSPIGNYGWSQGGLGGPLPGTSLVENYVKTTRDFYFSICDCNVKIFGACTMLKRCFGDLSNGILQAPKFLKFQLVRPKTMCNRLATTEQAGQKNRNGKSTCFSQWFLRVNWRKAKHLLTIGDDWMVDLKIIYIEKAIAKALDINDISKKFMGMSTWWFQISQ